MSANWRIGELRPPALANQGKSIRRPSANWRKGLEVANQLASYVGKTAKPLWKRADETQKK